MYSHRRVSRRSMRIWMVVNGLILVGLAAWILEPGATAPAPEGRAMPDRVAAPDRDGRSGAGLAGSPARSPAGSPATSPAGVPDGPERSDHLAAEPPVPTSADVLDVEGLWFGVSAPDVPWSGRAFDGLAEAAGAPPTMIQFFVHWTQDYPPGTVELSYQRGALPVLSWEPWAGLAEGTSQPEYALAGIIEGAFDEYVRGFAAAVRDHGWPVAIRFAHEMNGTWYPWSEQNSGNRPGEFVRAWRHVHDLFQDEAATNVIWLWSPNILRPVPEVSLEALYPGDAYVDWIGMVGYAVEEATAAAVFGPTREALREFTDKPLVITETGAQPGPHKVGWIEDFFEWLAQHPDVIGFIWFEYDTAQGGNADWRFTATTQTRDAFRAGLARSALAELPADPLPADPPPAAGTADPPSDTGIR